MKKADGKQHQKTGSRVFCPPKSVAYLTLTEIEKTESSAAQ
jgi:hypothetical protein